jgi:hypothetical protein
MSKFIQLTVECGNSISPIIINVDHIVYFYPEEKDERKSIIQFAKEQSVQVNENIGEIMTQIEKAEEIHLIEKKEKFQKNLDEGPYETDEGINLTSCFL